MPNLFTDITRRLDGYFYPNHKTEADLFHEHIERYLTPNSVGLDAGCGRGYYTYEYRQSRTKFLCGCDLTPLIGENTNVDEAVMANLNVLPFSDNTFDVIFSRYVLEHLNQPLDVFREISRILKPKGHFITLTPNAFHYVPLISRLTPHTFHEKIANLRGNQACDTFPTFYQANTRSQLQALFTAADLELVDYCAYETRPNYLMISPLTYALGIAYERLVNSFNMLSFLRVSIIAVARKRG